MSKRDLQTRSSWCILTIVTGLIFVTLSCAQDAATICRRIRTNDLKIRTMGLVGDKFIVLTAEGHLFFLPKSNLQHVDTSYTTLTIDQVHVSANKVFGVELDYKIQSGYSFFLLADGKSERELLLKLQVRDGEVRLRAFHLDWNENQKTQDKPWTEKMKVDPNKKFDFNPDFIVNGDNEPCATASRFFKETVGFFSKRCDNPIMPSWVPFIPCESPKAFFSHTHRICLHDDTFKVVSLEDKRLDDKVEIPNRGEFQTTLTGFTVNGPSNVFYLKYNGSLGYWNDTKGTEYHYELNNFILCGTNFTDDTFMLEPWKLTTSAGQSSNDKQTHTSGWIIATVVCLSIIATVMFLVLVKKVIDKRAMKRDNDSNLGSHASSAIESSNVGSSNASLGGSSALSSSNVSSGISPTVASSSRALGSNAKATESKHQTFADKVMNAFRKRQKSNAELRSKVKKTKGKKKDKKERSKIY